MMRGGPAPRAPLHALVCGTKCAQRRCAVDEPRPRMYRDTATATRHAPWSPQREHAQDRDSGRRWYCGGGLQRLEMFIAVMLARERRWHADTAADGCTELAVALAALPSLTLALVAEAVVALDCADA